MFLKLGNKVIEAEMKNGVPIIKAQVEEIKHEDGRVDIVVHVPCLTISNKVEGGN